MIKLRASQPSPKDHSIEPDEDEKKTFYLRIEAGHRYTRSRILVTLTRAQLETLIDAGKVALQETQNIA